MSRGRWRRDRARGVSAVIATVLMVALTVAAGVVLWSFKINTPPPPAQVTYIGQGGESEPAWGDPTDCTNTSIYANCGLLPAIFVVFIGHEPQNIPLNLLVIDYRCNGTSLVNGTLKAMEVIPGTGASPGVGSPKLGHCGTWKPSASGNTATYFNRLMYFQQIQPGQTVLLNGDQIVLYTHPHQGFCDRNGNCPDDDYHGAPPWCFTILNACTMTINYIGNPPTLVATIPVMLLGST